MSSIERVEQRIAELVAASGVPEDPSHSQNTLEWLLELEPSCVSGHSEVEALQLRRPWIH
jgi:hypothetical protein